MTETINYCIKLWCFHQTTVNLSIWLTFNPYPSAPVRHCSCDLQIFKPRWQDISPQRNLSKKNAARWKLQHCNSNEISECKVWCPEKGGFVFKMLFQSTKPQISSSKFNNSNSAFLGRVVLAPEIKNCRARTAAIYCHTKITKNMWSCISIHVCENKIYIYIYKWYDWKICPEPENRGSVFAFFYLCTSGCYWLVCFGTYLTHV